MPSIPNIRNVLYYPRPPRPAVGEQKADRLRPDYQIEDWRVKIRSGNLYFIVPWSLTLGEDGYLYTDGSPLHLHDNPGGTASLGIRMVQDRLHVFIPSGFYYSWLPDKRIPPNGERILRIHYYDDAR